MYDYVKSLGYTIVRSYDQTDAGAGFWNKHRGEDVRIWEESNSANIVSAKQLWYYISKIHPKDQQGGGFLKSLVMLNPQYELKRVPLSSLHIPNDEDEGNDPYGRAMFVDVYHAEEYSQYEVDKNPLVVDSQGYILDGAHRAWAASELLNKKDIMAYVPVKNRPSTPQDLEIRKKFTNQNVTEGQSIAQEIKQFIDSLTPDDVGVEQFPGYRVHYEGFTDDCKSSADYKKNPNKVYKQVYQDFVDREHSQKPVKSGMAGDEEYPILYSVFKVPQSKTVDTAERAYSIAYKKKQPWPRGSREEKLIRSEWQLSALYDQYVLKQGVAEGKIKLYTDPGYFGAEVDDAGFDSLPVVNISADRLVGFEPDSKMNQPKSQANVKKIVAGLKKGDKLPPLLVRKYKNGYQVLDGHHRFWAYKLSGTKSIPVRIVADKDIEEISKSGVAEGDLNEKSTSQAQFRTMAAAAHNPEFAKKVGIKQSVAKEFNKADRGQSYKSLPKKA
jgi:hypothetical protein